jgi:hypothetical protein
MVEWWLEQVLVTRAEVALGIVFFIVLCVFEVLYLSERKKRRSSQSSKPKIKGGNDITTDD